jgi:hypothetical protein
MGKTRLTKNAGEKLESSIFSTKMWQNHPPPGGDKSIQPCL